MKSTSGWHEKGNGNNKSGIAGHPGGCRGTDGSFLNLGTAGWWWSSSEHTTEKAGCQYLSGIYDYPMRLDLFKGYGLSVRCLRD